MLMSKLRYLIDGGKNIKIVKNSFMFCVVLIICISCHTNEIYLNKELKTVNSDYAIKRLHVELELSNETYLIECSDGYSGCKSIKLDSVPHFYHIRKISNTNLIDSCAFNQCGKYNILKKNESYIIYNMSNGDAGAYEVSFSTDGYANIK